LVGNLEISYFYFSESFLGRGRIINCDGFGIQFNPKNLQNIMTSALPFVAVVLLAVIATMKAQDWQDSIYGIEYDLGNDENKPLRIWDLPLPKSKCLLYQNDPIIPTIPGLQAIAIKTYSDVNCTRNDLPDILPLTMEGTKVLLELGIRRDKK
jgi:hypothetical protein